ncbi:MAG TPA: hypothetical protein VFQ61_03595, partial [Polyangiaceae bacterium]|nr:hypothetical protein [Polyangiaceae bacterium]
MRARFVEVALSLFLGASESLGALESLPSGMFPNVLVSGAMLRAASVPATALALLLPRRVLAAPQEKQSKGARQRPAPRVLAPVAVRPENGSSELGGTSDRAATPVAPATRGPSVAGPPARVLLRGCEGMQESEVERVLSAELGTQSNSPPASSSSSAEPTWIVVRCADGQITVEVNDPL